MARAAARPATGSCSSSPPGASTARSCRRRPRRRRAALAAPGRRDPRRRRGARRRPGRVPRLRRLRDDRRRPTNDAPGSFWQADVDEAAAPARRHPRRGGRRRPHHLRRPRRLRPPRPHPGAPGRPPGGRAGRARPRVFEATINRDHIIEADAGRTAEDDVDAEERRAPRPRPRVRRRRGRASPTASTSPTLGPQAGGDAGPRQPDRRRPLLPGDARRGLRAGLRHRVVHPTATPAGRRGDSSDDQPSCDRRLDPHRLRPAARLRRRLGARCSPELLRPSARRGPCSSPPRAGCASDDGAPRAARASARALASTFAEVESHVPAPLVQAAVAPGPRATASTASCRSAAGRAPTSARPSASSPSRRPGTPGASYADRPALPHVVDPHHLLGRRAHAVLRHDRSRHPPEERRRRSDHRARSPRSTTPSSRCRRPPRVQRRDRA